MQELPCDAAIKAHSARDLLHVRAALLAKVRHLVDEGDLGREKSVGCVFDELRRPGRSKQDRRLIDEERPVEIAHHAPRPFIVGANHDAIRVFEILDCRALAQKFRIGYDGKVGIGAQLRTIAFTSSLVPTGTVDLMAMTVKPSISAAIARAASYTYDRSAKPSPRRDGVPTARNKIGRAHV